MSIRNFFKKEKPKAKPTKEIKPAKVKVSGEKTPMATKREIIATSAYRVLRAPHITERAGDLTKKNQYVFKVWPGANKIEIKKAIRDIYGVDVLDVRIIKISGKVRRLGKQKGWREGYKKAIIRIKEGQKIEVLPR